MQYAMIQGTVTASQKTESLKSLSFKVIQPCLRDKTSIGEPIIAVDCVGARPGDMVMWVGKREASLAIPGAPLANSFPLDAAVTGIIDDIS